VRDILHEDRTAQVDPARDNLGLKAIPRRQRTTRQALEQ
jgi:hypothetical protein